MDQEVELYQHSWMTCPSLQKAFGSRVRRLRSANGHSQEEFAALANLDRGAFGKLERGEINVGLVTMARVATALGMSLSSLLEDVEYDPEEIKTLPRSTRGRKKLRTTI